MVIVLIGLVTSNIVWSRDRGHGGGRYHRGYGSRCYGRAGQGGYGHRNHYGNLGFYFKAPIYPYQRRQAPYYPPTVITVPVTPQVYIQQPPVAQQYPENYWYYCNYPEGYYPYIKDCRSNWKQVKSTPPR